MGGFTVEILNICNLSREHGDLNCITFLLTDHIGQLRERFDALGYTVKPYRLKGEPMILYDLPYIKMPILHDDIANWVKMLLLNNKKKAH